MSKSDRARRTRALSSRELEVVALVVDGFSNAEIARSLVISVRTVQAHIAAATEKTGTKTRTQLAVHALRTGLVPLRPAACSTCDPGAEDQQFTQ